LFSHLFRLIRFSVHVPQVSYGLTAYLLICVPDQIIMNVSICASCSILQSATAGILLLSARRACSFPSAVLPDRSSTSFQNNPPPAMQADALLVVVRLSVVAEPTRVTPGENPPACTFPSIPFSTNQYKPSCTYVPTATCLLVFMHACPPSL
jgi:hypothetical protein